MNEMIDPYSQLTSGRASKEVGGALEIPYISELPGKAAQNPCVLRMPWLQTDI